MRERASEPLRVHETFFVLLVSDMARATVFFEQALGGEVGYRSETWTSIRLGGVRLGLSLTPQHEPCETQLHFAVSDLDEACARVVKLGGSVVSPPRELAPGVAIARVQDPEGNRFSFSLAG